MVSMSASVNLPLHHKVQKFPSGTGSPGRSQKKGRKTVMVWCGAICKCFPGFQITVVFSALTPSFTSPPEGVHNIAVSVSVCLSVSLADIFQRPHVQTSRSFLNMLLCSTLCTYVMSVQSGPYDKWLIRCTLKSDLPGGSTGDKV